VPGVALSPSTSSPQSRSNPADPPRSLRSRFFRHFRTPKNIFGLSRLYFADQLPTRDPDEYTTLEELCHNPPDSDTTLNTPPCDPDSRSVQPDDHSAFYPYPNEASFRLGQWYWEGGVQKSQESFKQLLDIIVDPGFDPSHVRGTQWDKINARLASNEIEENDEWVDADAGWVRKPISISVPFHSRTQNPGVHQYVGGELYYRSLVGVIKEKIAHLREHDQFHFEPYQLLWNPTDQHEDIRVYGELYTSQAFLEAHRALQDSPGEPDCDLPRVVLGLMFWSDSTHLTSFGNAKLWPCYLYFGNESKYRRCKPSCHLCDHVAYFQKVSLHIYPLLMVSQKYSTVT
jgi:hypothetical protein